MNDVLSTYGIPWDAGYFVGLGGNFNDSGYFARNVVDESVDLGPAAYDLMLPKLWPLLVFGLISGIGGFILLARARTLASIVARRMHAAPAVLATLFLVRKRSADLSETERYLSEVYRFIGLIWTPIGLLMIWAVFFAKPKVVP